MTEQRHKAGILLVEDNPANQKLANYILQDRGHVVETAESGQEAICLTERNHYDVILMDVQMPGMNGLEATAAIRKRDEGRPRTPIVAMTAHAMKSDRDRCLAAGMDGYLSKPVSAREMIAVVESLARGVAVATPLATASVAPAQTSPQPVAPVFDPKAALSRCLDSEDMLRNMIRYFLREVDNVLSRMRTALCSNKRSEVM